MTITDHAVEPRTHARTAARLLVGLLAAVIALVGLPATASAATAPEQEFVNLINQERGNRGLAAVQLSPVISDGLSRPWSSHMASTNVLAHSNAGSGLLNDVARFYPRVNTVGENVGYSGSVSSLHAALMNSPGHRANILNPGFRYVGLGVVVSGSRMWLTQTFFTTPEYVAPPGPVVDPTQAQKYVVALYADFLSRSPDPGGLNHWSNLLTSGQMQRRQIAYSMATTDEWLNKVVNDFYVSTLGRNADPSGLTHWRNLLRAGMPVAEVAARFYASDEYFARAGSLPTAWVDNLYRKLLNRAPDAGGLAFWTAKSQLEGRVTVAAQFYGSQETLVRRVSALYSSLLHRHADPAGLATWPAVVKSQGDLSLASFLASSEEYWMRAQTR